MIQDSLGSPAIRSKKALNQSSVATDNDGLYSTQQICEALFGDMHKEKIRTQREITERYMLENQITRAEALNRAELEKVIVELADALSGAVMNSDLPRSAKENFLNNHLFDQSAGSSRGTVGVRA